MRLYSRYISASFFVCAEVNTSENLLLEVDEQEEAEAIIAWLKINIWVAKQLLACANDNEPSFPAHYLPPGSTFSV